MVKVPLVATKFYLPAPRAQLVSRPHLLDILDQGLGRKLMLVSAPAGFGKTTLVAEWAHTRAAGQGVEVAWLTLDEHDNEVLRFWRYVVAALQGAAPALAELALALTQSAPASLNAALSALLNTLAAQPQQEIALVLDDHHFINDETIHGSFSFFVDHLPPNVHLFMLTRADPPLPLARMRVRDQLRELRAADLKFSPHEAAMLLNGVMALGLDAGALERLAGISEGWIAGLQLAALSLRGRDRAETAGLIDAFSGQHHRILEYLAEEVLKGQPEPVQAFLLQTSILDRLSGPLCQAVCGQGEAQAILAHLARENLLTDPLGGEGGWYRYHRLLAEMLRAQLRQSTPGLIPELHRRAAAWYGAEGMAHEAMEHALAAGDFEWVAGRVEAGYHSLVLHGQLALLCRWLDHLPAALVRSRPRLSLAYAWALAYAGDYQTIEQDLQQAEASAAAGEAAEREAILVEATALRAVIQSVAGDATGAIANAEQALARAAPHAPFLRLIAQHALGNGYRLLGQTQQAEQALLVARSLAQPLAGPMVQTAVEIRLGLVWAMQGRLAQAAGAYKRVIFDEGEAYPLLPNRCEASIRLADIEAEWGHLEEAVRLVEEGIALAQQHSNRFALISGYFTLMHVEAARANFEAAGRAWQQAETIALQQNYPWLAERVAAQRVWLHLAAGESNAAVSWAAAYAARREREPHVPGGLADLQTLLLARVWQWQGLHQEALALLDDLAATAEAAGRVWTLIQALILGALIGSDAGETDRARRALVRTLELAQPHGFVRVFAGEGERMRRRLAELYLHPPAALAPTIQAYTGQLLAAFPPPQTPAQPGGDANLALIEPLTGRELEILHLLAAGASNQDVAQRLYLSLGTVKNHVSHILGKLGAQNRTEAVIVARKLGLVE